MDSGRPRSTLAALAYGRLREDIMNGELKPGHKLPVADLRDRYDIGLSPLREALNRLCADGVVTKKEQRGFFVSDISEDDLLEITNSRIHIEEAALRLSFCNRTGEWEERMLVAFHRLSRLSQEMDDQNYILNSDWGHLHHNFHMAVLSACGSTWLLKFATQLYDQSRRYRRMIRSTYVGGVRTPRPVIEEHRALLDSCLEDDVEKACDVLAEHYRSSAELLLGAKLQMLANPRRVAFIKPEAQSSEDAQTPAASQG